MSAVYDLKPCRWCGDDPNDSTLHKPGCPTLGTCAQHWLCDDLTEAHPDTDWLAGRDFTVERFTAHMRDEHGR